MSNLARNGLMLAFPSAIFHFFESLCRNGRYNKRGASSWRPLPFFSLTHRLLVEGLPVYALSNFSVLECFCSNGRSTVYNIEEPVDCARFPHFSQTRWLECIQEEGEAIFVPSGWFHQVNSSFQIPLKFRFKILESTGQVYRGKYWTGLFGEFVCSAPWGRVPSR
jgi:hypothetical protein